MIAGGIVLIIFAIGGIVGGSIINYNVEMHAYSSIRSSINYYDYYRANSTPGTIMIVLGVIVLILGIILLLVGVVKHYRMSNTDPKVKALYDLKLRGLITQQELDEELGKINRTQNTVYTNTAYRFCGKCGERLVGEYDFCPKCGCRQDEVKL